MLDSSTLASSVTVPRLPTVVTSGIINHLPLCTPAEPSHVGTAATACSTQAVPSTTLLHAVCGALLSADVSQLAPRLAVQQPVAQPGTLEHALLELNPHIFRTSQPGSTPTVHIESQVQQQQQQQQQLASQNKATSKTKAARPANADEGEKASKRRKTGARSSEEYVSRVVDCEQVAASVAEHVNQFLSRAAALNNARSDAAQHADAGTEAAGKRGRKSAGRAGRSSQQLMLPLELLRELQGSLASGKQAGILSQLDQEQLRQLLLLLLDHLRLGQDQLIDEQDTASSDSTLAVTTALEAACCCLHVLAAPGMHSSLYMDELVTSAVNLAKYQLQYNVLALHDAHYKRLYRPESAAQDAGPAGTRKRRQRESTAFKATKVLADVRAKLELLLSLLAQVVERIVLEVELLLPLVRVGLACLSIDSLQLLQAQVVALAVSVFRAYPQQRSAMADEVLSVVGNMQVVGSRAPARLYEATGALLEPLPFMMVTGLLLQLVQVSVELPEVNAEAGSIQMGFRAAYGWSDYLWKGIFGRLPAAKAAKSEGATDLKVVVQALLADLLTVQMLPEWPAASILLKRCIKQLAGDMGLKHKDAAVKLACVELTGQLATALSQELLAVDREVEAVQALKQAAQAAADEPAMAHNTSDMLVLDYLAAACGSTASSSSSSSSSPASAARRFVCCRMLHDAIHLDCGALIEEQKELQLLLVQHRRLQDAQVPVLGAAFTGMQLNRQQVVMLLRQQAMSGSYGNARSALIRWLLEAGSRLGSDPSPATVRTKAFKCLAAVVEADSRVMASPEVAAAVQAAQEDDSAAVKEAVLELLSRLISINPELAVEYFETLRQASFDSGIMVRKRAIRALWECCSCPGFSRAADAVVAVLQRANDKEDSMRSLVTKICGEMWFTDASSFTGLSDADAAVHSGAAGARTVTVRAHELATLSAQLYEAGGRTIHVPLAPDHGLIVIFKEVLGIASSSSTAVLPSAKEAKEQREQQVLHAGAVELAQVLLGLIPQQQQESTEVGNAPNSSSCNSSNARFPYLLALHVLTAADPSVATPDDEPQRFVRCLAPYLSEYLNQAAPALPARVSSAGAAGLVSQEDASRRAAEEALCLISVLDAVISHLGAVEQDLAQQLVADLQNLLTRTRYLQLIAASAQLLCSLARCYQPAALSVTFLANRVYNVTSPLVAVGQGTDGTTNLATTLGQAPRVLFVLGQLCRHGSAILDAAAAKDPSNRSCSECLELCVSLWYKQDMPEVDPGVVQRVRDAALQMLGLIIIGRPQLMLQPLQLGLPDQLANTAAPTAHSGGSSGTGDGSPTADTTQQQLVTQGSGLLSGVTVVRVYTSVLSEPSVSLSIKGRVLSSLVELLRAEETALLARQREADAATAASKLPSTLPADVKAPLARVNGEGDAAGGSGSSSIIQCVWRDVLRLATGVSGAAGPPAAGASHQPASVAGVQEAAFTRRKALELIEVVLRGGLVAPWDAVPPLVAQLTDELPETRAAALKVLKTASEKYTDFVANQLAPGVLEAFSFQSRLWATKHPGQPLPKGPSPEVIDGLSAMYSDIVQPVPNMRARFLTALLKPFDAACNLAANPAAVAREDSSRLAFCVYVAANLPYKKADEPLVLLHAINSLISRMAQEVRDVLRRALLHLDLPEDLALDDEDDDAAAGPRAAPAATPSKQQAADAAADAGAAAAAAAAAAAVGSPLQPGVAGEQRVSLPLSLPLPQWLAAPIKASLGMSMLLILKQYLMAAYSLGDERVAQYELKGERGRAEAKALVSRAKRVGDFSLSVVKPRALQDGTGKLLVEQFKTFAALLDNDAANYREVAVLAALADHPDDEEDAAAPAAKHHPSATPAAAAGLVVYSMEAKTKSTRARGSRGGSAAAAGRGSTGGRGSRGRGTGRTAGSRGGKKAKPRRRRFGPVGDSSSDEEPEAEAGSGDEDWGSTRSAKVRKLFD